MLFRLIDFKFLRQGLDLESVALTSPFQLQWSSFCQTQENIFVLKSYAGQHFEKFHLCLILLQPFVKFLKLLNLTLLDLSITGSDIISYLWHHHGWCFPELLSFRFLFQMLLKKEFFLQNRCRFQWITVYLPFYWTAKIAITITVCIIQPIIRNMYQLFHNIKHFFISPD